MFQVPMECDLSNRNAMISLIEIAPAFSFVLGKDFSPDPSATDYRQGEFGNAVLVMTGPKFSLRFERDRGQVFIDVGSARDGWHKLEYVLEFANPSITQQQLGEPPDSATLADLLLQNWDTVTCLFSDRTQLPLLRDFSKERASTLLSRIFRTS